MTMQGEILLHMCCAPCSIFIAEDVITSYSIHYTKLYDDAVLIFCRSGWYRGSRRGELRPGCGYRVGGSRISALLWVEGAACGLQCGYAAYR